MGADLRCLYAVGEIDDYELLKRNASEALSVINNMHAKIRDRLRHCQPSTPAQVRPDTGGLFGRVCVQILC